MDKEKFHSFARQFGAIEFDENYLHLPTAEFKSAGKAVAFLQSMKQGSVTLVYIGTFIATLLTPNQG